MRVKAGIPHASPLAGIGGGTLGEMTVMQKRRSTMKGLCVSFGDTGAVPGGPGGARLATKHGAVAAK